MKPEVEQSPWEVETILCQSEHFSDFCRLLALDFQGKLDRLIDDEVWPFRSEAFIDRTGRHG